MILDLLDVALEVLDLYRLARVMGPSMRGALRRVLQLALAGLCLMVAGDAREQLDRELVDRLRRMTS